MFAGIIPEERLQLIPTKHHATHEFCFFIHDQMAELLRSLERNYTNEVSVDLKSEAESESFANADDIFEWLSANGYDDVTMQVALQETARALFADALHFIYEGLKAFEKRKFTVAFALFRKPLKESLPFAAWLLANPSGFYEQMAHRDGERLNSTMTPEQRSAILERAVEILGEDTWLSVELLDAAIFDRSATGGFAGTFDKATHLTTSHKKYATEPLNLNFIFLDPHSDHLYEQFYQVLAHALVFMVHVQMALYGAKSPLNSVTEQWLKDTITAVYHSIFLKGRSPYVKWLNADCADLLICVACGHRNSLRKADIPRLYLAETFDCKKCFWPNQFPLFWMMSRDDDGRE